MRWIALLATAAALAPKDDKQLALWLLEPSRTIDEVRTDHWARSIQEVTGRSPPPDVAASCYSCWKSSRLELLTLSPAVCALLEELRGRYKLLLLTNGESQTQWEKV